MLKTSDGKSIVMKVFKEAVLVSKMQGVLEIISFFDTDSMNYGVYIYFKNKLIEIIQPLSKEPKRSQMRNPWKLSKQYPWRFDVGEKNNHKVKKEP